MKTIGMNMAGTMSITLMSSFGSFSIFRPMAMISSEPTQVILAIIGSVKTGATNWAKSTMAPWNTNTNAALSITPKPKVLAKIRVEIITEDGNGNTFVMSFHFAEKPFDETTFPYKKKAEV